VAYILGHLVYAMTFDIRQTSLSW